MFGQTRTGSNWQRTWSKSALAARRLIACHMQRDYRDLVWRANEPYSLLVVLCIIGVWVYGQWTTMDDLPSAPRTKKMPAQVLAWKIRTVWMKTRLEKRITPIIARGSFGVYRYSSHGEVAILIGCCSIPRTQENIHRTADCICACHWDKMSSKPSFL
jgi:hypothetical protein